MADEKMSDRTNTIRVRPGTPGSETEVTVGDADEKPGMVVTHTGETSPEADLCASTEDPAGVLLEREDLDIDTAITAAEGAKGVRMQKCGMGGIVWVFYQANGGGAKAGDFVEVGTEDGKVVLFSAGKKVGRLEQDVTNDAANDQVVKINLSV